MCVCVYWCVLVCVCVCVCAFMCTFIRQLLLVDHLHVQMVCFVKCVDIHVPTVNWLVRPIAEHVIARVQIDVSILINNINNNIRQQMVGGIINLWWYAAIVNN